MTKCVSIPNGFVCFDDRDDCIYCNGSGICIECDGEGCQLCEGSGFCSNCGGEGLQPEKVNE